MEQFDELEVWRDGHSFPEQVAEAAEAALLMLDPEVCCDFSQKIKRGAKLTECCPELLAPFDCTLPFVLSGAMAFFNLGEPLRPAFAYPFVGGAPLAAARRQAAFNETTCDVLGRSVQQSQTPRVFLHLSKENPGFARACTHLGDVSGFDLVAEGSEGLSSPTD